MAVLQARLRQLQEEFSEFEDGFERYAYLVELAALLPPYPEQYRTAEHLVRGCQSQVWLHAYTEDGMFFFHGDSDTLIIKGVLLILRDLLCGVPLDEVSGVRLDVLAELGLADSFSDTRQKGIGAALAALRAAAQTFSHDSVAQS